MGRPCGTKPKLYGAIWLIIVSGLQWHPAAQAQDLLEPDSDVEEIVVTTRKRQENLQEVPISIGVFNTDDIYRNGIRDLDDVSKLSPSLQFDQSFSTNSVRVTVRGLSNTRGRSNVAFLVDGIDVTSETTGNNAGSPLLVNQRLLTDVERIEVVRGPQSALFGRVTHDCVFCQGLQAPEQFIVDRFFYQDARGSRAFLSLKAKG